MGSGMARGVLTFLTMSYFLITVGFFHFVLLDSIPVRQ